VDTEQGALTRLGSGTADDPSPPGEVVKLVFIHHSCGDNWLDAGNGGLGDALGDANTYVSDTYYGWGPDDIGSRTDIGHWWTWFRGPESETYTTALYTTTNKHASYTRPMPDPGGENEIVMFKSCYPNSRLGGSLGDPIPDIGSNPLRGQSCGSAHHTVGNAQGIYNDLLTTFAARQDKLFVVVTAPPMVEGHMTPTEAGNARDFNDWLVHDWLDAYAHENVAVFDFYNVLTSNGGEPSTNDLGAEAGNHHRWWNGAVQHVQTGDYDYGAYGADHPNAAGNQKATGEFVELLNVFYHRWRADSDCVAVEGVGIAGPTEGTTDTEYTFAAVISPTAVSPPITYTWWPAPPVGEGQAVTYSWPATGTHAISVTVEHCGGSASTSHTITLVTRSRRTLFLPLVLRGYGSPTPPDPPTGGGRLQASDLDYQGAFAYPAGDRWAYGGHALAYYPNGDPDGPADGYPGSLYAAGHVYDDLVGELAIPAPAVVESYDDLPGATVLHPLTDITGGLKDTCTYAGGCVYREVDGLAYVPASGRIGWNLRDWYNVGGYDQDSLGWSTLDMTGAQGVWHIGERPSQDELYHNARTCNYLFNAPQGFADAHLDGKSLIAGNHRAAGAFGGSQGPTLYAVAPWQGDGPPASGGVVAAEALLSYREIYPGCLDDPEQCDFPDYRPADLWGGGAWVEGSNGSGVLIVGRKGLGPNCYGTAAACGGDACVPSKGYHAYPYEPQILFYDREELREVAAGSREPWSVLPYETYSPVAQVFDPACAKLGAAAYDRARGLLYVTEQTAGLWGETAVHVWRVE